jgi:hypothetical protein
MNVNNTKFNQLKTVLRSQSEGAEIKLLPGAEITKYCSGSLLFYRRLEETS